MRPRERQRDNLLKADVFVVHDARTRVYDDFVIHHRLRARDEVLNAGSGQVNQLVPVDKSRFAASAFQEDSAALRNLAELIKVSSFDDGLPPLQLTLVDCQFVNTVGVESNEALRPAFAEVERLVEPNIL